MITGNVGGRAIHIDTGVMYHQVFDALKISLQIYAGPCGKLAPEVGKAKLRPQAKGDLYTLPAPAE